jgi:hypothetical protein
MNKIEEPITPQFEVVCVEGGRVAINDRGRTVAIVTRQGYIDWLLRTPAQEGPLIDVILKGTHLSYTMGVKLELICASVGDGSGTELANFSYRIEEEGTRVVLIGEGVNANGNIASRTEAQLGVTANSRRYAWKLKTEIVNCTGADLTLSRKIEYNNVYPSLAYRGILHGEVKEFDCTLLADEDGTVWRFAHQHSMHYGRKIAKLGFARTSWAGFFGPDEEGLVVEVDRSDVNLHWEICDMYYDLHCCAIAPSISAGGKIVFSYHLGYRETELSCAARRESQPIPIDEDDRVTFGYPRLDLGMNRFDKPVMVDRADEALCFRPRSPEREWERPPSQNGKGALRLQSEGETVVWGSNPPVHAVNGTTLSVSGLARVQGVEGRGFLFRVRCFVYCWEPEPGFYPLDTVESIPLTGTTDGWIAFTVPDLSFPAGPVEDQLIRFELVLDGKGVAWLMDLDVRVRREDAENGADAVRP